MVEEKAKLTTPMAIVISMAMYLSVSFFLTDKATHPLHCPTLTSAATPAEPFAATTNKCPLCARPDLVGGVGQTDNSFVVPSVPLASTRLRDSRFYTLIAGAAKTTLVNQFLQFQLAELLAGGTKMTAGAICQARNLDPHRGWKFLHLCSLAGLLVENKGEFGDASAEYSLTQDSLYFFGADGTGGQYFRDLLYFHNYVEDMNTTRILQGEKIPKIMPVWPPPTRKAAQHLEMWMTLTAHGATATVVSSATMARAHSLLDVGGGDGTVGCDLTLHYPNLQVTVFNLPHSAELARANIKQRGREHRVNVVEGDFFRDEFPKNFKRVMFSRVLTDWNASTCVMALSKARRALAPKGRVVINEALLDGNRDYSLAWEYRYLYYDGFGRNMYKSLQTYTKLLNYAGLQVVRYTPMPQDAFYSVIEATALPDDKIAQRYFQPFTPEKWYHPPEVFVPIVDSTRAEVLERNAQGLESIAKEDQNSFQQGD